MPGSPTPRIVSSERLTTGIVVHFEGGESVFYPAPFLYQYRAVHPNELLVPELDSSETED